ncbi:MAG: hypothetical protein FWC40_08935 [Proteobacteria bacterium]|nr:hypothetical protein [Pseudomonadota bacterium]
MTEHEHNDDQFEHDSDHDGADDTEMGSDNAQEPKPHPVLRIFDNIRTVVSAVIGIIFLCFVGYWIYGWLNHFDILDDEMKTGVCQLTTEIIDEIEDLPRELVSKCVSVDLGKPENKHNFLATVTLENGQTVKVRVKVSTRTIGRRTEKTTEVGIEDDDFIEALVAAMEALEAKQAGSAGEAEDDARPEAEDSKGKKNDRSGRKK